MNEITLNENSYRLLDTGDGEPVLIITSREETELLSTQLELDKRDHKLRALRLNISAVTSSFFGNKESMNLKSLARDIHALLDIYWLDHVYLFSDHLNHRQLAKLQTHLGYRATIF
ncbi:hypothetical protein EZV61_13810 [Corallincola luteus]|uniref:Uncharacterized protein n=1 Tax=Corallincola luteus TaxID=1775177 RepID=A0ABY2AJN7_9GAMM|nr:hypothetical protein [Corallincola luteus]TCI02428.1 hypothetical protein EZV61_13810 [Corallincola luteus]